MSQVLCELCNEPIPPAKVRKGGIKRKPRFCSREHANAWLKSIGHYERLSVVGNAAQKGNAAIHKLRSQAVSKSNQEKPRRKRQEVK